MLTLIQNFYPRSPCGERPWARGSRVTYVEFLSTLSLRRATSDAINGCNPDYISIHALLAESDDKYAYVWYTVVVFLSTLSLRRATRGRFPIFYLVLYFYPRSPCGERPFVSRLHSLLVYFYPRSPCGERQLSSSFLDIDYCISIHALLAESDWHS